MLKHYHMTLALISVVLLTVRFILTLWHSKKLNNIWLKVSPHIIDSALLLLGIVMAVSHQINPIEQLWLAEKLGAILVYIFMGYYTLKLAQNKTMQSVGYLAAMVWMIIIVKLAITKVAIFL